MPAMLSVKQKLVVLATCFIMVIGLLVFFPWWLAILGILAMAPFVFATVVK
ncbi:hypothetical protein [Haloparvum sp. AD34]